MIALVIVLPIIAGVIGLAILILGLALVRDDQVGVLTRKMFATPFLRATSSPATRKWAFSPKH